MPLDSENANPVDRIFAGLENNDAQTMSTADQGRLIGRTIYELTGRSARRMIAGFAAALLASFLPTAVLIWLVLGRADPIARTGTWIFATPTLLTIAAILALSHVLYSGLRDVVKQIGLGRLVGAAFAAHLNREGMDSLALPDFTQRLKAFTTQTEQQCHADAKTSRWAPLARLAHRVLFFAVRVVLNRIAKGSVVDGTIDVARFSQGVGEKADQLLVRYLRTLLWDLVRLVVGVALLILWGSIWLIAVIIPVIA